MFGFFKRKRRPEPVVLHLRGYLPEILGAVTAFQAAVENAIGAKIAREGITFTLDVRPSDYTKGPYGLAAYDTLSGILGTFAETLNDLARKS